MKTLLIGALSRLAPRRLVRNLLVGSLLLSSANASLAAEANTSALAGSTLGGPGSAAATAGYVGDRGFSHSDARSGRVNTAGAVALGVDESGLSLSISNAIARQNGPAIATNYNLSVGRDGRVSSSAGVALADGLIQREARAAGNSATTRDGGGATSVAEGSSDRFGTVRTHSTAHDSAPRLAQITPRRLDGHRRPVIGEPRSANSFPSGVRGVRRGLISPRAM